VPSGRGGGGETREKEFNEEEDVPEKREVMEPALFAGRNLKQKNKNIELKALKKY